MLYLLATMERGAPAAMCEGWENSSGPDDPTDLLTANQYLYCQLSDNLQADIDAVQAAWDASRAANQAELAQKEQELATVRAQFEQQMALLNCPVPIVPYADITGDYATGITISCHDGYDLVGAHPHMIHRNLAWVVKLDAVVVQGTAVPAVRRLALGARRCRLAR